jgi:hypothetical protein
MYNDYVIWFKDHFNFHPTDNEFKFIDPINELIEIRKDIVKYINSRNQNEVEYMKEKLNLLKVITFDEYKDNNK